eukprot:gene9409-12671_t
MNTIILYLKLFFVIIYYVYTVAGGDSYYSFKPNKNLAAAVAHSEINDVDPKLKVRDIAVFLLASMTGARQFGVETSDFKGKNFFDRIVMANYTYTKHVEHFYMVVGDGANDRKVVLAPSHCINLTSSYEEKLQKTGWGHMYSCMGIKVLYLPDCEGSSWGAKGPCCRCEKAMLFYLLLRHSNYWHNFPNWFTFSDDDYFVRLYYLEGLLESLNPAKSFVGLSGGGMPVHVNSTSTNHDDNKDKTVFRPNFGEFPNNKNCSIPCVHRYELIGWAMYSYGALLEMENALQEGELQNTCSVWVTTHDIGLGIFSWLFAHVGIGVSRKASVLFHQDQRLYDQLFEDTWQVIAKEKSLTKFDMKVYVDSERQLGRSNGPYPLLAFNGYQSTLFERRRKFLEVVQESIGENKTIRHPPKRSDYNGANCNEDMDFFLKWKARKEITNEMFKNREGFYCMKYTEHVLNSHVPMERFFHPTVEDFSRKNL